MPRAKYYEVIPNVNRNKKERIRKRVVIFQKMNNQGEEIALAAIKVDCNYKEVKQNFYQQSANSAPFDAFKHPKEPHTLFCFKSITNIPKKRVETKMMF